MAAFLRTFSLTLAIGRLHAVCTSRTTILMLLKFGEIVEWTALDHDTGSTVITYIPISCSFFFLAVMLCGKESVALRSPTQRGTFFSQSSSQHHSHYRSRLCSLFLPIPSRIPSSSIKITHSSFQPPSPSPRSLPPIIILLI